MSSTEDKIYRKLQEHLNKLPIGFPSTESGVEIRLLRHFFTPEEAQIAILLRDLPETIWRIHKRVKKLGVSKDDLKKHLTNMDEKGAIFGKTKGKRKYYRNQILAIGMYEYQINRVTKEFMVNMTQYLDEAFGDELVSSGVFQSRILPVEKSLPYNNFTYNYDNVRYLIRKYKGQIVVANCICRVGYDKMGQSCTITDLRESCLVFRAPAKYYINHGYGRPITKEKAFEILDEAEKSGLILQAGNSKKINFICTCCACCCGALKSAMNSQQPVKLYQSNYYASIDPGLCIGCKTCIDRCQMGALSIVDQLATIDYNLCIGCGLCITSCSEHAIKLRRKKKQYNPPRGPYLLFLKIAKKRLGRWKVIKLIMNAIVSVKMYYLLKRN
ncbi:MAG: 4Fe-4S binding protein [Promethearchaeota archaeon]|jgi:ferredoxin